MFPLANKNLLPQQRVKKAKPICISFLTYFLKSKEKPQIPCHSDGIVANNLS